MIERSIIERKGIIINKDDKCCICLIENYNFLSSCNHCYCLECFLTWKIKHNKNDCCYCKEDFIIENCVYMVPKVPGSSSKEETAISGPDLPIIIVARVDSTVEEPIIEV